ncbi:glutamate synthase-related protein [Thiocystis violacea]|uniref:glutamate synthase-related protein n=1 Tax=Thiocystis violacea TaxID=13725 RepID=UPI0019081519
MSKLFTPADVAWVLCIGADCVCSARGFMFTRSCIQAPKCDLKNTRPTGITSHAPGSRRGSIHRPRRRASRPMPRTSPVRSASSPTPAGCARRANSGVFRFRSCSPINVPYQRTLALDALYPPPA